MEILAVLAAWIVDSGQLTLDADGERGRDIRRLAGTQPPPSRSLLEQAIQMSTFFMEKTKKNGGMREAIK